MPSRTLLTRRPSCCGLSDVSLMMAIRMQRMDLKAGDVLVREGQPMPGVYW